MLATTLLVFGITLVTFVPLATGLSPFNLPAGLSALLHSVQAGWQDLARQGSDQGSTTGRRPPQLQIPHSQLVAIAQQDAVNAGIDPTYFVRQITLESGFNPNAVSPGGAEGIAQFEPSTAAGLGINPFDPIQALQAAAQMMARYYHQYGDYAKALAAYNAGPASLQNAENSCGANWLSCMPAQTQNYVHTIMG
jgi:soluble lytic murein transglycosylase-like protein